jgi:hypothetical protein
MTTNSRTSNRLPIVRFFPEEWGYGPLGNALHIARAIRDIAANAIQIEIILSNHFRGPVDSGVFDKVHSDIASTNLADALITIMNVEGIVKAAKRGERIYAVDALAWLWDEPLPIKDLVHTYFYQEIPVLPVPKQNFDKMPNATPISAIGQLPEIMKSNEKDSTFIPTIVVSLSGLETPASKMGLDKLWYPPYILDALEQLAKIGRLDPGNLAIFGNYPVIKKFAGPHITRAVRERSSQQEFSFAARSAGTVVCSPGLTTIVECLRAGIGVKLLPAQNFGQVKQMSAFVDAIGLPAIQWKGAAIDWLKAATLPGDVRRAIMRGILAEERLASTHVDPESLLSLLVQDAPLPSAEIVEKLIGPDNGAMTVASRIVSDLL